MHLRQMSRSQKGQKHLPPRAHSAISVVKRLIISPLQETLWPEIFFIFIPINREDTRSDEYFSNGSKPPSSAPPKREEQKNLSWAHG